MKITTNTSWRSGSTSTIVLLLLSTFILSGCNQIPAFLDFRSDNDLDLKVPSRTLATKGMDDYNVGKYFTALEYFEEILDRYPFSPEATLAELKAADCNFHMGRYLESLMLYKEFEERHPTNEAIPYVMFQKAMTHYKRIDRVDRDTTGALESIKLFNQLLRAYPNSPYTSEAQARAKAANEFLANHEYCVVEFYVRTEKFDQAEKRLNYLLAMYPDSGISDKAKSLLARIEADDPPTSSIADWFPKLSLPDWTLFED
ncbi:outer membrane protein assembly factor BamD [Desulfosediminicola flagellatus]|uniref:outer membrane protein assembly factor BamD n=1 Tax=Desulfosediminicola flagellatus TaxID=2569541 RepID=UPI0010ACD240|nr:outer membrane protein assembly factor BamD [Desulfosediminicola flagellatus]